LFHELRADPRVACFVGECAHEAGQVHLDGPHSCHALAEAVRRHLPLVPVDEYRIDGNQAEATPHAQRRQQVRFPETDHRDVDGAADLQEARLLEMADDEGVVSRAFRFERVSDRLRGAAEFRERMEEVVWRIEAVHFEADAGSGH
jgi:hypothetical protein